MTVNDAAFYGGCLAALTSACACRFFVTARVICAVFVAVVVASLILR